MRHPSLLGTFVVTAAALLAGCRATPTPPVSEGTPARVRVAAAESDASGLRSPAAGIVAARVSAVLTSRVAATVTEIPVREGDRVARGQPVVLLDARDITARIVAAEAAETAARAEKSRVDQLADRGAATAQEKDQATAAEAAARATSLEARAALSYLRLVAPENARVAAVSIHAGDVVMPGRPLVTLEADRGFELQATLEASAADSLRAGQAVLVRVDGLAEPLTSRVKSVSPAGDPSTHRFLLRADLPDDPRLRSGLFATAEIPSAVSGPPRILVPTEAVMERGGLQGVFTVEENRAHLRWVALGESRGRSTEIRAGVREGDRVVLSPGSLADGAPIQVVP